MSHIQRYRVIAKADGAFMQPSDNGDYVEYVDHERLMQSVQKQYTKAELRATFEATFESPPSKIDGKPVRYEESELNAEFGGWCDAMEYAGLLKKE